MKWTNENILCMNELGHVFRRLGSFCFRNDKTQFVDMILWLMFAMHYTIAIKLNWSTDMVDTFLLTRWGRVTHICVGNLTIIDSDNGLSPRRR